MDGWPLDPHRQTFELAATAADYRDQANESFGKGGHIVDHQTGQTLQAVLRGKARRILRFRICVAGLHRRSSDGYIRGREERQCHLCASRYGWPGIGCMDAARCGWATVTVGGIWVDPPVVAGFPGPG